MSVESIAAEAAAIGQQLANAVAAVATQISPPSGQVLLAASNGTSVTALISDDIDRGGGVGGWQTSDRVFRRQASWFQATPLATITIPCILDINELPGGSLEDRLTTLYEMGQPGPDQSDPPSIRLFGDMPTEQAVVWRLDGLEQTERLFQPHNPLLLRRVTFTLTLTELDKSTGITPLTVKRTRDSPTKSRTRTIAVKAGQTLRSIAVQQLGQSSLYTQIQGWNPSVAKTDPDAPLRAGLKLVLR